VSVQRTQASIKRGQQAGYTVQVSTKNGSAAEVSVVLTAQPASQKATFTGGCGQDDGTATCRLGTVTTKATSLTARIAVAAAATSVSSVKLTATASVVTTAKWTPPAADETTAVTAAAKRPAAASSSSAAPMVIVPLGPIPALNGEASLFVGAGNAADLFPTIAPSPGASASASPSPAVATRQPARRNSTPAAEASPVSLGTPVFTAQVAGLIALGLAIMLTVTRLSVRRRSRPRG
jgi:hypothetical protein